MNYWQELYDAWDSGRFAPVYHFYGDEEYIKKNALARLRSRLLVPGLEELNETILEGSVSAEDIIEAAETLPVMAPRRLVLVRDWAGLLQSERTKGEEDEKGKKKKLLKAYDIFAKWLDDPPPECTLVFYTRPGDKIDEYVKSRGKAAKKNVFELLAAKGKAVSFDHLDDRTLFAWIAQRFKAEGSSVDRIASEALVTAAGRDCARLNEEIMKLASLGDKVDEQLIRRVVTPTPEATVFEMVDDLTAGRLVAARQKTDLLLRNGDYPTQILYMVTRQIRLLCLTRECLDAGTGQKGVMEAADTRSTWLADRLISQARPLSPATLRRLYEECTRAEYLCKSGRADHTAMLYRMLILLGTDLRKKQ